MPLFYRTYSQLAADIREWSKSLPNDIIAVAGIPRSGMIVASMLMAERNVHILSTDELESGANPWLGILRRNVDLKSTGRVLVVDDTCASGEKMLSERSRLANRSYELSRQGVTVEFGAVYIKSQSQHQVDHFFKDVGVVDHVFEWNWMHHWFMENSLVDMDGVLCEDWPHGSEVGLLESLYADHLTNARQLVRPTFKIGSIVTGRLEIHRERTEAWLRSRGVQYEHLFMFPAETPAERAAQGGPELFKTKIYNAQPKAWMFVESCPHQAAIIASNTNRPVLSYPEQRFFNGTL